MVSKYLEVLRKLKDILMMVFLPGTHGLRGLRGKHTPRVDTEDELG